MKCLGARGTVTTWPPSSDHAERRRGVDLEADVKAVTTTRSRSHPFYAGAPEGFGHERAHACCPVDSIRCSSRRAPAPRTLSGRISCSAELWVCHQGAGGQNDRARAVRISARAARRQRWVETPRTLWRFDQSNERPVSERSDGIPSWRRGGKDPGASADGAVARRSRGRGRRRLRPEHALRRR